MTVPIGTRLRATLDYPARSRGADITVPAGTVWTLDAIVGDEIHVGCTSSGMRAATTLRIPDLTDFAVMPNAAALASSRARISAAHDLIATIEGRLFGCTDDAKRAQLGAALAEAQTELRRACHAQSVLLGHTAP